MNSQQILTNITIHLQKVILGVLETCYKRASMAPGVLSSSFRMVVVLFLMIMKDALINSKPQLYPTQTEGLKDLFLSLHHEEWT